MSLVGANPKAEMVGLDELPGKTSYFIGDDPKKWETGVPNYGRVKYKNIYPGVDLVYYGNQRQLEYDFVVAPGADPNAVRFNLAAVSGNSFTPYIDETGDLVGSADGQELRFQKPVIYQTNAKNRKKYIDGRFVFRGNRHFGFEVASYDHTKPLVIDPATYLGGGGDDYITAIALSGAGVYVTGTTNSDDFPGTVGRPSNRADTDVFVALLSPDLKTLTQVTIIGGVGDDLATSIAVSGAGVYVAGYTTSVSIAGQFGGAYEHAGGGDDGFITLLSPDLKTLIQSTFVGDSGDDYISAIAVGPNPGHFSVFVAGTTDSIMFPHTQGGAQPTGNGGETNPASNTLSFSDGFAAVFSSDLKTLDQATYLGGILAEGATSIALSPSNGFVYVAGNTQSGGGSGTNGFPHVATGAQASSGGPTQDPPWPSYDLFADGFVAELTADLTTILNATYLGGNGVDSINSITVTSTASGDQVYVAGITNSTDFPGTPSSSVYPGKNSSAQGTFGNAACPSSMGVPACPTNNAGSDGFVTWLSGDLTQILNSSYLGGSGDDAAYAVRVFGSHVYVAGRTTSGQSETTPFPSTSGGLQPTYMGGSGVGDAFLADLSTDLTAFGQNTYLGGAFDDEAFAIVPTVGKLSAVSTINEVYVAGETDSISFTPSTAGGAQAVSPGKFDEGFVALISLDRTFFFTQPAELFDVGLGVSSSQNISVGSNNSFNSAVNFTLTAPSGFSGSFNPPSVVVPAGGSASTDFNLAVGPSVIPGAYGLDVIGTSGQLTISIPITVKIAASTPGVEQVLSSLQADGCMGNSAVAKNLTIELNEVQNLLNTGHSQAAVDAYTLMLLEIAGLKITNLIHPSCKAAGIIFDPTLSLVGDIRGLIAELKPGTATSPITGYVVDSKDVGIPGAKVSLLDPNSKVVATAMTDLTGFYYFPSSTLNQNSAYTVQASSFSKLFKTSAPASQLFTWEGTSVMLQNFVLN